MLDGWSGKYRDSEHAGMYLGKPKLIWSRNWWGRWKPAWSVSADSSAAKARLGKIWVCCWVERLMTKDTEKNKAVRAFYILIFIGKTRPPKPTGKSRVRKTYPWWRRICLGNTYINWSCTIYGACWDIHPQLLRRLNDIIVEPFLER